MIYKIVKETDLNNLASSVNNCIKAGFEPIGGISSALGKINSYEAGYYEGVIFFQAMIYDPELKIKRMKDKLGI